MRIAFVSTILSYPWGGADVLWTRTAAAALGGGHAVFVATNSAAAQHPRVTALASSGAVVHERAGYTQERGRRERWGRAAARWLGRRSSLTAALDRFRPDALFLCQGGVFDFLIEDELRRWISQQQIPTVAVCQSFDVHEQVSLEQRLIAERFFSGCAACVFVSTQNRDAVYASCGVAVTHAHVVPNPIELNPPGSLPWPAATTPLLAAVGRLEPDKGIDLLLQAAAELPRDLPWSIDVFGRGPDEAALRQTASNLSLEERVRFVGYATDVRTIWANHHALVLPSRREGCSLAMLEALACGRPVFGANVGGVADWVVPQRSGDICEPGDVDMLARMLGSALRAFDQWREWGRAGAARIAEQHPRQPEDALLRFVGVGELAPPGPTQVSDCPA